MPFSFTIIFIFSATILFLFGWLGLLPIDSQRRRNRKWLLSHGRPVVAHVEEVRKETVRGSQAVSWVIIANWSDPVDGTAYRFKSERLKADPSNQLRSGVVNVLIDPNNPRKHYVDLSEIHT